MSFSKFMCMGSPKLMERVIKGWPCNTGKLILCKRNSQDGKPLEYYTVDMENVVITSYQMSASGGGQLPMESFSLDFVIVKPNYVAQADDGSGKTTTALGGTCRKIKKRKPEPKRRVDAIHPLVPTFQALSSEKPVPTVSGMFQSGRVASETEVVWTIRIGTRVSARP